MSAKDDGPWPTNDGVSPISHVPDEPADLKAVIFGTIHFPHKGKKFRLSDTKGDAGYRVEAIINNQVQLARDVDEPPWTFSYYFYLPLATWWTTNLRRALKISGGSVDSWRISLDALVNVWDTRHTSTTAGTSTHHVYEISFKVDERGSQGADPQAP